MRTPIHQLWMPLAAVSGLLAVWQPATLYLAALAVFGLPHVLWETAWVWRLWRDRVPRFVWCGLLAALLLQAASRLALWLGRIDAPTAAACDAATLALALLATLGVARRLPAGHRVVFVVAALSLPVALVAVADTPQVFGVLAVLAIAHNFTPVGLAPPSACIGAWPARGVLLALFSAPILLFVVLAFAGAPSASGATRPAELGWIQQHAPQWVDALLPALVWAQCLHYLSVIHLMPRAIGSAWRGMPLRPLALAASILLLAYFIVDYPAARGLYAVAAGMHAWLEWPLILLAVAGFGSREPDDCALAAS
ncbi:hypothetical protein [Niveibacterium sp. COAC-50]|uniref:hypothetical protein n=1 Tax=Niveibacterium sp. COAC-50 TaxID=2729384 RepID=UPI00155452EA|nr:hypothetical protein [Niveibacterium sp. COAC-50]